MFKKSLFFLLPFSMLYSIRIKNFYQKHLRLFGYSVGALRWKNHEIQVQRYEKIIGLISTEILENKFSVLDYGSGFGDFANTLVTKGFSFTYLGVELLDDFRYYATTNTNNTANISFSKKLPKNTRFDVVCMIGSFNISATKSWIFWSLYIQKKIHMLWKHCDKTMVLTFIDGNHKTNRNSLFQVDEKFLKTTLLSNFEKYKIHRFHGAKPELIVIIEKTTKIRSFTPRLLSTINGVNMGYLHENSFLPSK